MSRGDLSRADVDQLRDAAGPVMGPGTLQGRVWLKAYGYAGDFQIIDDIYTHRVSDHPVLRRWDECFQGSAAPQAVRNRKGYFKRLLLRHLQAHGEPLHVLNIASGPCRDVAEFFEQEPAAAVHITCLDQDANAIAHARRLCAPHAARMTLVRGNALKYSSKERFGLVWSAGLFDYFPDAWFVTALRRLGRQLLPGGQMVVGNFSPANPERAYMEIFGDWVLHHRSADHLAALAQQAGFGRITVEQEPLGINLFLHCAHA